MISVSLSCDMCNNDNISRIDVIERVVALKKAVSSSGQALFDLLRITLNSMNINLKNCIADAFDGAANMNGQYQGVQAKLKEVSPRHIHIWCYAHILNLVLQQTTSYSVTVISFFGLMQELYVFFKESYKRLNIYEGNNYRSSHLINIGATRWRCKSDSVQKIFGRADMWIVEAQDGEWKSSIYVKIVLSLYEISQSNDFNVNIRSNARSLLGRLTSYETTLTAMTFLQIFKLTTPLSDYLQTSNLDYIQAYRKIVVTEKLLKQNQRNFTPISTAAKIFINFVSEKIWEEENEIEIDFEILQKRKRMVSRRLEGNIGHEETIHTPEDNFKINTFFPTMDVVVTSMEQRFAHCKELYGDLELFDPRRFKDIRDNEINPNAMNEISQLLPTIDNHVLLEQLKSFAHFWPTISKTTLKNTDDIYGPEYDSEDYFEDDNFVCKKEENCMKCLLCVANIIHKYNMYSLEYKELFKVYLFLLTIPLTQVTCERSFSKLKIIKTRLRSCINQENLEALF